MRRVSILSALAALFFALPATAAQEAPVAIDVIDADLVRWATTAQAPKSDLGVPIVSPLFEGVEPEDVARLADEWRLRQYKAAYFLGVPGGPERPLSGPQGRLDSGLFRYNAPAPSNVLPHELVGGLVIQTDSMQPGCEGIFREISVSVARPGLPTHTATNEFIGDPGIDHNLVASVALRDCQVEFPYLELVDGGYQLFQTRLMTWYWDDGETATAAFFATAPTFDGEFTVTASQALIDDFEIGTAFKQHFSSLSWSDVDTIDASGDETVSLGELANLVPSPFVQGDGASTTSSSLVSTTSTLFEGAAAPTGQETEADSGGLNSLVILVGLMLLALLGGGVFFYTRGVEARRLIATILIPTWFVLPEEYVWILDADGARWVSREDAGRYKRDPYQPFVAIAARDRDPLRWGRFSVGGYYDAGRYGFDQSGQATQPAKQSGGVAEWGRLSQGFLEREIRRSSVSIERDEEGNKVYTIDADPHAPESAERVEVWVDENMKVAFLVDDPWKLMKELEFNLETEPDLPGGEGGQPIGMDGDVAPS